MTSTIEIERQLREHYDQIGAELRLASLTFDELVDTERSQLVRLTPSDGHQKRPIWSTMAVAAAVTMLIGGGVAVIASRSDRSTADVPTDSQVLPPACSQVTAPSTGQTPQQTGTANISNTVLLPAAIPTGYCPSSLSTSVVDAPQRVSVWSTCDGCTDPTGSVAYVRHGEGPDETETPERPHEDIRIEDRNARFYPANSDTSQVSLVSRDGQEPGFGFYGWGIDLDTLTQLAESVMGGSGTPHADGLTQVFDGEQGAVSPGVTPADVSVTVNYAAPATGARLTYSYIHSPQPIIGLEAYVWTLPNATFTTVNGRVSVESTDLTSNSVLIQQDTNTVVILTSTAATSAPLTISDLSSLNLTPAPPTDPRWDQISEATGN